ncbi:ExbD/TolR family protein [Laspinema olomoucense]|uniref:ExbD/TolR family protein n=1 Tax=Laspinema olomoucense TaxID=3231600 RepID=UPI0021BAB3EA|nr:MULTISPECIES: biopolymer transporter ExbD [unclassified Laspinema]MCT7971804.1 biopolymer transporter ExbD [Laspinema sp. D3d]MCT7989118.1 biopolymer transporter ExbD [Laspinema sp. D3a]MCT7993408.1 biopolymer transporter ExbD [Laspinema sp. D3c]
MRLPDEAEPEAQINIVPMIDVIFSILAFFIVSSLSLSKSEGLPVNLPQASTAAVQTEAVKLTISIDAEGVLMLDEQAVALEDLEQAVRDRMKAEPVSVVVLKADKSVEHGQVVEVMDRVRRIEGAKLAIAAEKP